MYDNSLIPVALANKLMPLSDFPSQRILKTFAKAKHDNGGSIGNYGMVLQRFVPPLMLSRAFRVRYNYRAG
jgi:hypothetical protein